MIVTCKHCATRFKLDDKLIKPSGIKARCSSCKSLFRVYPSPVEPVLGRSAVAAAGLDTENRRHGLAEGLPGGTRLGLDSVIDTDSLPAVGFGGQLGKMSFETPPAASVELDEPDFADIEKLLGISPEPEAGSPLGELALEAKPAGETARNVLDDTFPPTLDIEMLELGPDIEGKEEGGPDLDFGAGVFEVSGDVRPESPSDPDLGLDFESVDSLDMEDLIHSLEIEDAPVEEEVPKIDIESFDLLADDTTGLPGAGKEVFSAGLAGGMDDLDPAEIEVLLDMGTPGDFLPQSNVGEELRAGEEDGAPATDFNFVQDEAQTLGPDGADDLNIDQLEKMIDGEQSSLFEPSAVEAADLGDGPDRPSHDQGMEGVKPPAGEDGDITYGVDLADVEFLLDQESASEETDKKTPFMVDETDVPGSDGDLDLEFDFDIEEKATQPPPGEDDIDVAAPNLTDLEQMFEKEVDEPQALEFEAFLSAGARENDEKTLDFSDIEKLLEEEVKAPSRVEEDEAQDLELVLDFPVAEETTALEVDRDYAGKPLEREIPGDVFSGVDEPFPDASPETDIFDLDLDLEDIPEEFGGASVILEGEDGLELETLTRFGEKETVAAESIDRLASGKGYQSTDSDPKIFEMGRADDDIFLSEEMGGESAVTGVAKPKKRKANKVRAPFWVLLILALLGGGGFAAFKLIDQTDIRIPFVDQFFKKETVDPGTLFVSLTDVNSRFLTNSKVGIIFVVTGRARNGYDHPRSYFEVRGVLKAQDGRPVKTQKVYCGNVLSEKDLADLELAAIQMRLNNRAGANRSNLKVPSERTVPFMLVFSDLPADLGEFSIAPAGSVPAN